MYNIVMKPCILLLTCADEKEADAISSALLSERLIVCVKKSRVTSDFYWERATDHADEVLLIMDSSEELFDRVEAQVGKLHSYKTFNLVALPVIKITRRVRAWMEEGLAK